jgi:hypothetical protein
MTDDLVTLVCPPGAEGAVISHGAVGHRAYLADPRDPHSRRLVDVPREAALHLCRNGGFTLLDPAGQT